MLIHLKTIRSYRHNVALPEFEILTILSYFVTFLRNGFGPLYFVCHIRLLFFSTVNNFNIFSSTFQKILNQSKLDQKQIDPTTFFFICILLKFSIINLQFY